MSEIFLTILTTIGAIIVTVLEIFAVINAMVSKDYKQKIYWLLWAIFIQLI